MSCVDQLFWPKMLLACYSRYMSVLSVVQTLYLSVLSMSVLFSTSNLFQLKTLGIIESSRRTMKWSQDLPVS